MNRNYVYLAMYHNDFDYPDIIGVFSTVDKAEQAVADTLIECLHIDEDTPMEKILDEYLDCYTIDKCTIDYNYMV